MSENNKDIILSIIPTTYCENGCKYCYLGPLRNNKEVLSLEVVRNYVEQFKEAGYNITSVQIYGGDLDSDLFKPYRPDYFDSIAEIVGIENIGITGACGNNVSINIERSDYKKNLKLLEMRRFANVMTIVLPKTYKKGPKYLLDTLGKVNNWKGYLNVYPYQIAAMADETYEVTNRQYCEFMIGLVDTYLDGNYDFYLSVIEDLENNRIGKFEKVFGSHVFIFPVGRLADTRYTENGLEYFDLFHTVEEWEERTAIYKQHMNLHCLLCEYNDRCMAEHYKPWKDNDICGGLIPLMKWWEENRGRLNS